MKKILLYIMCAGVVAMSASAAPAMSLVKGRVPVSDIKVKRLDGQVRLTMDLDFSDIHVGRDRQLTIIPVVHNADSTDAIEFHQIDIAGHNIYFSHLRNHDAMPWLYKQGSVKGLQYIGEVADAEWLDEDAELSVYYRVGGCCDATVEEGVDHLAPLRPRVVPRFNADAKDFNYVAPVGDTIKTRELKKTAYIDFPVDQTIIYPDYRRNTVELAKIQATIDSVRNDADITITEVQLKGFASPESPYKHNTDLAIGRTNALQRHIQQLYRFPKGVITTAYEPEDWEGLRRFVAESNIDNKQAILAIIDSDLAPDPKEAKIKAEYPAEYLFMLQNWYPALRHTDYKIDYVIRQYNTVDEILSVMATEPQKLSLSEFYRAAQTMQPGTPEFSEVMETAVKMYPSEPTANLNAANAAMSAGDYERAAFYLNRIADDDADASVIYARGMLAALQGDYDRAEQLLAQAARLKVADAPAALDRVRQLKQAKAELEAPQSERDFIIIE